MLRSGTVFHVVNKRAVVKPNLLVETGTDEHDGPDFTLNDSDEMKLRED